MPESGKSLNSLDPGDRIKSGQARRADALSE